VFDHPVHQLEDEHCLIAYQRYFIGAQVRKFGAKVSRYGVRDQVTFWVFHFIFLCNGGETLRRRLPKAAEMRRSLRLVGAMYPSDTPAFSLPDTAAARHLNP
jgi:hypothetical protein